MASEFWDSTSHEHREISNAVARLSYLDTRPHAACWCSLVHCYLKYNPYRFSVGGRGDGSGDGGDSGDGSR